MTSSIRATARGSLLFASIALAALPLAGIAAGLSVSDTRLIMDSGKSSVAIVMSNTTPIPFLTKAWIEDVHGNKTDKLMVVPPVVVSVPNKFNRFQVSVLEPQDLPQDKESVFYLQTHSAPGNGNPSNSLNVSYNTKLKVFYRPKGLSGSMDDAIESLHWTLKAGVLTAKNDSNFNVSVVTVGLDKNFKQLSGFMIAPKSSAQFQVTGKYPKEVTVRWAAMDDFGSPRFVSKTIPND